MDTTTMSNPSGPINREIGADVGATHRIRRTIGRAWLSIAASGEKIRNAIGIHHSQVTYRKEGRGAFSNAAVEIDALESAGICTDPLLEAIERVQLAARPFERLCPLALTRDEASADSEEDVAAAAYHTGQPGAAERWASALLRQARESRRLAQVLLTGGAR